MLSESEVRERLAGWWVWRKTTPPADAVRLVRVTVKMVTNSPPLFPYKLEAVGVRWTGDHYEEVPEND